MAVSRKSTFLTFEAKCICHRVAALHSENSRSTKLQMNFSWKWQQDVFMSWTHLRLGPDWLSEPTMVRLLMHNFMHHSISFKDLTAVDDKALQWQLLNMLSGTSPTYAEVASGWSTGPRKWKAGTKGCIQADSKCRKPGLSLHVLTDIEVQTHDTPVSLATTGVSETPGSLAPTGVSGTPAAFPPTGVSDTPVSLVPTVVSGTPGSFDPAGVSDTPRALDLTGISGTPGSIAPTVSLATTGVKHTRVTSPQWHLNPLKCLTQQCHLPPLECLTHWCHLLPLGCKTHQCH